VEAHPEVRAAMAVLRPRRAAARVGLEQAAIMIEHRRGPSRATELMREPRRFIMRARAA